MIFEKISNLISIEVVWWWSQILQKDLRFSDSVWAWNIDFLLQQILLFLPVKTANWLILGVSNFPLTFLGMGKSSLGSARPLSTSLLRSKYKVYCQTKQNFKKNCLLFLRYFSKSFNKKFDIVQTPSLKWKILRDAFKKFVSGVGLHHKTSQRLPSSTYKSSLSSS